MIEIDKLYILNSSFIHFLANLGIDLDEVQSVATTCMSVEAHANFVCGEVI